MLMKSCHSSVANWDIAIAPSGVEGFSTSYNEKLWMLDLLKAVTYPPS